MMDTNPPPVEASNPPVAAAGRHCRAVAPETAGTEYVVVKGDSLWKIAKKNGVTLKALEAANPGVDPTKLKVGQKLSIPARHQRRPRRPPTWPLRPAPAVARKSTPSNPAIR